MLIEVHLKTKQFQILSSIVYKKTTEISEMKLSLPYSKAVQKYFLGRVIIFCSCSQILTTKPASSLIYLFNLPSTQVGFFKIIFIQVKLTQCSITFRCSLKCTILYTSQCLSR